MAINMNILKNIKVSIRLFQSSVRNMDYLNNAQVAIYYKVRDVQSVL